MDYVYLVAEPRRISICERHEQSCILHPDRVMAEHDLVYVLRGEWEIWQNDCAYTLHQGDCLLLAAGQHHYGLTRSSADCETIYVHFSACAGDRLISENESLPTVSDEAFLLPVQCSMESMVMVQALLRQVVASYWAKELYALWQADANLMLLLAEIARACCDRQAQPDKSKLIQKIQLLLETNSDRFYTSEELAEFIGVSSRTLLTYFKDMLGMTVRQYQLQVKLEKADKLLAISPEMPLSELAERLGFCDEYHLSKQYKKKFGYSPKRRR